MSAKDPPVARRPLTFEQLKAFAKQLQCDEPAQPRCDCVPYGTCPVCVAERGQSVPHHEENE